jgi:hypothetical protein
VLDMGDAVTNCKEHILKPFREATKGNQEIIMELGTWINPFPKMASRQNYDGSFLYLPRPEVGITETLYKQTLVKLMYLIITNTSKKRLVPQLFDGTSFTLVLKELKVKLNIELGLVVNDVSLLHNGYHKCKFDFSLPSIPVDYVIHAAIQRKDHGQEGADRDCGQEVGGYGRI